jgi:hypothetical protein
MIWASFAVATVMASGAADCTLTPLEIQRASRAYDGGSLIVAVADSSGCLVQFSFDYRLETPTRGRIYLGSGAPGSTVTRLAGPKEKARLIGLLQASADNLCGRDVQDAISAKAYGDVALTERDLWEVLRELKTQKGATAH